MSNRSVVNNNRNNRNMRRNKLTPRLASIKASRLQQGLPWVDMIKRRRKNAQRTPRSRKMIPKQIKNRRRRNFQRYPPRAKPTKGQFLTGLREGVSVSGPDSRIVIPAEVVPKTLSDLSPTVIINATIDGDTTLFTLLPIIAKIYEKGYLGSNLEGGFDPNTVSYCFKYLQSYLWNCTKQETPPSIKVPLWLSILGQAITPKIVKYRTGFIDYRWNFFGAVDFPSEGSTVTFNGGSWTNNYNFILGQPTAPDSAGYSQWIPLNDTAYTDELGARSFNLIFQQFSCEGGYCQVSNSDPTYAYEDASAFCANENYAGNSAIPVGGYRTWIRSEVPIKLPLFAVFENGEAVTPDNRRERAPSYSLGSSGDATTLGSVLANTADGYLRARNTIPYKFKFIDFNELWYAWTSWLIEAGHSKTAQITDGTVFSQQIPITLTDARLIFRNALLCNFSESQSYGMSINYDGDLGWIPFMVAPNCNIYSQFAEMLFPCIMAENLKSLRMRRSKVGTKGYDEDVYIPSLGVYNDLLFQANPTWGSTTGETLFQPDPSGYSLDLIDCHNPQTNAYIDANCAVVQTALQAYNNYVSTYLANVSVSLCTLSSDNGIAALEVLSMTRVWQEGNVSDIEDIILDRIIAMDPLNHQSPLFKERLRRDGTITLDEGTDQFLAFVTSQQPILTNAWSDIQSHWVLPSWRMATIPGGTPNLADLQTTANEPYKLSSSLTRSDVTNSVDLFKISSSSGIFNVVSQGSIPPGAQKILDIANRKGEGGDVGDLIEAFATWVGGNAAGVVVRSGINFIKRVL